ncbi:hypothetical protein B296_00007022 [Ensete ventricosum]|uniref:Uncharacterized protein n=1 Tax=Ensete ventricosum TaxID=4639 RepID=A0A427BAV2_ENSVE|nr:hypothetical protein B296_00007022 [Ensete ventricosum]
MCWSHLELMLRLTSVIYGADKADFCKFLLGVLQQPSQIHEFSSIKIRYTS